MEILHCGLLAKKPGSSKSDAVACKTGIHMINSLSICVYLKSECDKLSLIILVPIQALIPVPKNFTMLDSKKISKHTAFKVFKYEINVLNMQNTIKPTMHSKLFIPFKILFVNS